MEGWRRYGLRLNIERWVSYLIYIMITKKRKGKKDKRNGGKSRTKMKMTE